MEYKILKTEEMLENQTVGLYDDNGSLIPGSEQTIIRKTIHTQVEYTFPDKTKSIVDVYHFEPASEDDILIGITNRYITELRKIES